MSNRAPGRNVHIYSANDQDIVLGGLVLNKGMTNYNFHSMVEIYLYSKTTTPYYTRMRQLFHEMMLRFKQGSTSLLPPVPSPSTLSLG